MTICGMRIACWIPMATNAHPVYVALIDFHLQKLVARKHLNIMLCLKCLSC
jgi:hypothetical protein